MCGCNARGIHHCQKTGAIETGGASLANLPPMGRGLDPTDCYLNIDSGNARASANADVPRRTADMGSYAPVYGQDRDFHGDEGLAIGFDIIEEDVKQLSDTKSRFV